MLALLTPGLGGARARPAHRPPARMKAPARMFRLSDWYGEDWDHKSQLPTDDLWVSPWAKAHYKIRQTEIEIEQCEFMLKQAIDAEDYAEADGLQQRADRLRSQHPIRPREERLAQAVEEGDYAMARVFQKDLDAVKANLGLPKYDVGQAIRHKHREGLRGVVMDVDLQCTRSQSWIEAAGCLERGCALDYPSMETEQRELIRWAKQPFYIVMLDLKGKKIEPDKDSPGWGWNWPRELAAWDVNNFEKLPAPLYLAEEAISHDTDDENTPVHPDLDYLFSGYDLSPHRGRVYQPSPRLRLWQQDRAKEMQERRRQYRAFHLSNRNPYNDMR